MAWMNNYIIHDIMDVVIYSYIAINSWLVIKVLSPHIQGLFEDNIKPSHIKPVYLICVNDKWSEMSHFFVVWWCHMVHRNGKVVRLTALIFTGDDETCLQCLQWISRLSSWRHFRFSVFGSTMDQAMALCLILNVNRFLQHALKIWNCHLQNVGPFLGFNMLNVGGAHFSNNLHSQFKFSGNFVLISLNTQSTDCNFFHKSHGKWPCYKEVWQCVYILTHIYFRSHLDWEIFCLRTSIVSQEHSFISQKYMPLPVHNWPHSQIPECTCSISHNATSRTEMCTFLFWMLHCGIWNRCILGFVKLVYYHLKC